MPLDYSGLLGVKSPIDRAFAGYAQGTAIKDREQAQVALQLEQDQKQQALRAQQEQTRQMNEDLAGLSQNPNAGPREYAQVMTKYPQLSAHLKSSVELLNEDEKQVVQSQALDVFSLLQAGENDLAKDTLTEFKVAAENSGDTEKARGADAILKILETNPEAAKTTAGLQLAATMGESAFTSIFKGTSGKGGASQKAFQPVTLVNAAGTKMLVTPVFDPESGTSRLEEAAIPEGFSISRETADEKRAADIATVGAKKGAELTGKGIAKRRQVAINQGFDSSEQIAGLKRAKSLLDIVKTGGVNAASIRAKQLFGVEGANEAELSNALSKAVLKQLKPTFGAAFTAEEGKALTRISAGFGKSVEGNKRILDQLIREIEKKAKQGIKAAVASEDFEAAQRIKDNLAFTLDTDAGGDVVTPTEDNQVGRFQIKVIK